MGTVKVGVLQIYSLTVLFELGTALVVNLGFAAGKDAWISVLTGCFTGVIPVLGYIYLYRRHPDVPLTGYARRLLGNIIGSVVATMYIILFLNLAARDLRDGSTMLAMSAMHRTPLFILSTVMILSCAYVAHKGVEVLARTSMLFALFVTFVGIFGILLLLISGAVHLTRLQPVLGDGLKPVILSVLRQNYMFPFGEMISFTMLMPYLSDPGRGTRMIIAGMVSAGILLSATMALNMSVLGEDIVKRSPLPLMPTISKVSISDFIQRVDVLVVMVLIIGVFFKIAVFFTAALVGLSDLFGIPYRSMAYPGALIVLFTSMLDARNFIEHLDEGGRLLYTVYPFFTLGFPALFIVAGLIRRQRSAPREG